VTRRQPRLGIEALECRREGGIALLGRVEEPVVGGLLLDDLPDALDRVELRRVGRQPKELDAMAVLAEPGLAVVVESRGAGPGAVPVTSPSTPSVSYHCSQRLIELRSTPNSAAMSTTRRPSMYPSTARPRRHRPRSCAFSAARMNRRSFLRPVGLFPRSLIASPVFARAMTTLRGDRRMLIFTGSGVNFLMQGPGDPV